MPFVPIPDTVKIEIVGLEANTLIPIVNVLHARSTGPASASDVSGIANAVATEVIAHLDAYASSWEGNFVRATALDTFDAPQAVDTSINGQLGTLSSPNMPANCCVLVQVHSTERSRRGRGRIYHPMPNQANVAGDGTVSSTLRSTVLGHYSAMETALEALAPVWHLAVASRVGGISWPLQAGGLLVEKVIASQRRRIAR